MQRSSTCKSRPNSKLEECPKYESDPLRKPKIILLASMALVTVLYLFLKMYLNG